MGGFLLCNTTTTTSAVRDWLFITAARSTRTRHYSCAISPLLLSYPTPRTKPKDTDVLRLNTPREARRHNLPTCFLLNEAIFLRRALLAVVVVVSGRRLLVRGQFGRAPRGVSVGEDANARHVLPRAAATALARDRRELGDALDDLLDAAVLLVHNARRRELGPDGQRARAQLAQRRDPPPRERVAALMAMTKGTMITTTVAMG